jgi:hypothetical protein
MSRSDIAPRFAEAILRLYLGRSRASTLIGDLLEESTKHRYPALHFWAHAGWLLALFTGRSTVAYLAAACVFSVFISDWSEHTFGAITTTILSSGKTIVTPNIAPFLASNVADAADTLGCMGLVLAIFSFIRFGPLSRITLLSFGLSLSTVVALWRVPADWRVLVLSVTAFCVTLLAGLWSRSGRRTLSVIGVSCAGVVAVTAGCKLIQSTLHLGLKGWAPHTLHHVARSVNGVVTLTGDIFVPGHVTNEGLALLIKIAPFPMLLVLTTLASSLYTRWVLNNSPGNIPT